MEKMNRELSDKQLEIIKTRNVDAVMENINFEHRESVFCNFSLRPKLVLAISLMVFAFITMYFVDFGTNSNPLPNPFNNEIVLDDNTTETLVELSYISGSLMSKSLTLSNTNIMNLAAKIKKTEIGTDIEEVNSYFDMLKVFLEDNPFDNNVVVEELIEDNYQSKISFTSEGTTFDFYINLLDENIEGVLYIEDIMYSVLGKQTIDENESKLELRALNGSDYVDVEYILDSNDLDTTQKYNVETSINGIITKKSIKISIEDSAYKITIEDLNSKYNLKKNFEDDQGMYKLDYTIDGEKGRANIYEDIDEDNNPVYRYEIREGSLTETIIVMRPAIGYDDQSNPSNEKKDVLQKL